VSPLVGLDRLTRQPAYAGHLDALLLAPRPDDALVTSLVARVELRGGLRCWRRLSGLATQLGLDLPQLALELGGLGVQCSLAALGTFDFDEALDCVTCLLGRSLHRLHRGLQTLVDQRLKRGRSHGRFSSWVTIDLAEDERREEVAASRPVDADPVKSADVVCDDCRVISVLVRR
jgi:hypothetical protein